MAPQPLAEVKQQGALVQTDLAEYHAMHHDSDDPKVLIPLALEQGISPVSALTPACHPGMRSTS